jgi:hypothetical protein
MKVTVDIPEALHAALQQREVATGESIDSLIVQALEQSYPRVSSRRKGRRVTGPMVHGKLGPRFPVDENPHDLIFD